MVWQQRQHTVLGGLLVTVAAPVACAFQLPNRRPLSSSSASSVPSAVAPPPHLLTTAADHFTIRFLSTAEDSDAAMDRLLPQTIRAVGATTSVVVSLVFAAALAYYRDALMVSFFLGAISNGIVSKVLKKIINQTRPQTLSDQQALKIKPSDGGMPSSHAMSLGFICTFTALQVPWTRLPLVVYAVLSLIYRVQTSLHTWLQIGVGLALGGVNGVLWWHLCHGTNRWNINAMAWTTEHLLNSQGLLPAPLLLVPAIMGLAVVGSFERRISRWVRLQRRAKQRARRQQQQLNDARDD